MTKKYFYPETIDYNMAVFYKIRGIVFLLMKGYDYWIS